MEINPRFQSSTFVISRYLEKYKGTNVAELHYCALKNLVIDNVKILAIDKSFVNCNNAQVASQLYKNLNREELALKKAIKSPYFARIDFKDDFDSQKEEVYIGKCVVFDEDKIKVVDWRSPIDSLYYDFDIGRASYTCPDGKTTIVLYRITYLMYAYQKEQEPEDILILQFI